MSAYTQQSDTQQSDTQPRPQAQVQSNRNRRRCSICGDTQHDRRFHTVAERAYQVNTINANREIRRQQRQAQVEEALAHQVNIVNIINENRRLQRNRQEVQALALQALAHQNGTQIQLNPSVTAATATATAIDTVTVTNTNNHSADIMRLSISSMQQRQQQHQIKKRYFKYTILQSIGREEKYINNILTRVRNIANTEYKGYLIQYALEIGCPPRPHFDDYVFRIVSLLYLWFNDIKINFIDEIIIGNLFMKQPDVWYCDYYTSIDNKQKREKQLLIHQLKLQRIDNLIVFQKLTNHCNLTIDENSQIIECPICYETKDKILCVQSNCNHDFCRDCFNQFVMNTKLSSSLHCPMCRNELTSIIAYNYYSI